MNPHNIEAREVETEAKEVEVFQYDSTRSSWISRVALLVLGFFLIGVGYLVRALWAKSGSDARDETKELGVQRSEHRDIDLNNFVDQVIRQTNEQPIHHGMDENWAACFSSNRHLLIRAEPNEIVAALRRYPNIADKEYDALKGDIVPDPLGENAVFVVRRRNSPWTQVGNTLIYMSKTSNSLQQLLAYELETMAVAIQCDNTVDECRVFANFRGDFCSSDIEALSESEIMKNLGLYFEWNPWVIQDGVPQCTKNPVDYEFAKIFLAYDS